MKKIFILVFLFTLTATTTLYLVTKMSSSTQKERNSFDNKPAVQIIEEDVQTNVENVQKVPANIIQYKNINSRYLFVLDYLEYNPCFTPGGALKPGCVTSDFFINKLPENIELPLSKNSKFYVCFVDDGPDNVDLGPDNDPTNPDTEVPLSNLLMNLENYELPQTYYFSIKNNEITGIYEQCLP